MNIQHRMYRFALIGVSESGKTCILGSLAASRDGNDKYSSSLLPPDSAQFSGKELECLQNGFKSIEEARNALQAFKCPRGTASNAQVMSVIFNMGSHQEQGEFWVYTEDYAGELINPHMLTEVSNEDLPTNGDTPLTDGQKANLSKILRDRLSQYDGLIFVMETLRDDESREKANTYMQNLVGFFTSVRSCISDEVWQTIPIAVLLSKWDKYSEIDTINPDPKVEEEKLAQFLSLPQNRFYKSLINPIRNTQARLESKEADAETDVLLDENTKIFPVSAFGKYRLNEQGKYEPDENACAFNLVEPFVWMAHRRDMLDCQAVEKMNRRWFRWVRFGTDKKVCQRIEQLCSRIPDRSPERKKLQKIKNSIGKRWFCSALLVIALVVVGVLGCMRYGNQKAFNEWGVKINNQNTSIETLKEIKWQLEHYIAKPHHVPFSPSKKAAKEQLAILDKNFDEIYWQLVPNTKSSKEYLADCPKGKHVEEAKKLVKDEEWNKSYGEYCQKCEGEDLNGIRDALIKLIDEFDFAMYQGVLENFHNIINSKLDKKRETPISLETRRDSYRTAVLVYNDIVTCITTKATKDEKSAEDIVRTQLKSELQDYQKKYEDLGKKLDQERYDKVCSRRSEDACTSYLALDEPKMKKEVEAFLEYLKEQTKPQNYKVHISVRWNSVKKGYKLSDGELRIDGKNYSDKHTTKTGDDISLTEIELEQKYFKDTIPIEVKFVSNGNMWRNGRIFGECVESSKTIADLIKGVSINLNNEYGYDGKLILKADEPSQAPKLPAWHE